MAMIVCVLILLFICNYAYMMALGINGNPNTLLSAQNRYAIMVDAGSSGSRLFVYCIPIDSDVQGSLPSITLCSNDQGKPLTMKVSPGLSTLPEGLSSVQKYIFDLLSFAAQNVPEEYHTVTPVFILATAGMRLLPENEQDDIWETVRTTVKEQFRFKFYDSWAKTVSGFFEALFGWITVNYLLDNFADPSRRTVGMLDMGGGSMQIAYEVPLEVQPPVNVTLPFTIHNKRTHRVYVMTFLGYGTHAAKSRYKSALLHNAVEYSQYSSLLKLRYRHSTGYVKAPKLADFTVQFVYTTNKQEKFILSDPCLQPGLEDTLNAQDLVISRSLLTAGNSSPIIAFHGTGNLRQCIAYQKSLLQKHKPCRLKPCSMNGIYQPPVDFESIQFYAMSEYWYTSSDLGTVLMEPYMYDVFDASASVLCKTPWNQSLSEYKANEVGTSTISNKKALCFKASWIINVLHMGFGFGHSYSNLHPIDKLAGIEVQWSLGAIIYYMQLPEFKHLISLDRDYAAVRFTQRQTAASLLLLLIFLCLSSSAYYVYYLKRRQRFNLAGIHRAPCCASSFLLPIKRLWHSPKMGSNSVISPCIEGSASVGGGGGGGGGKRALFGNYPYVKISSSNLHVNFRSSNSLHLLDDSNANPSSIDTV